MEWVLASGLGYGACIATALMFLGIAVQRARPGRLGRFALLALTSVVWFGTDLALWIFFGDTIYAPERSPLRGLVWSSLPGLFTLLAGLYFYAGMPLVSRRQINARRDFGRLLAISGAAGFAWFWLWGWAGHAVPAYRTGQLLGAAAVGLLPVVYAFMITVNPLVNVWRLFRRVSLYLSMCFVAAAVIYGVLFFYYATGPGRGFAPGPFVLYFVFLITAGLVGALGILHHTYLKAPIPYIFFRDVYLKEKVLNEFVNEVQAMDSSRENQDSLLEIILQNVYRVFNFEKGLIVAAGSRRDVAGGRARHIGPPPARLGFDRAPFLRLRLSEGFLRELDQAILLEDDFPEPFSTPGSIGRHPRVAQKLLESIRGFKAEGYTLFLPLIFRGEVWGALFLGPKADGLPYFNGERKLLENARMAFAMALRNNAVIEEREQKAAEQKLNLPDPVAAPSTRMKLGDRSLVFASDCMHRLVDRTRRIASSVLPVLIQGETGAGKELIARLLHHDGPGPAAPFVAVNCAAIPATLWESEIFGYRKGAFTGATTDHPGLVEQAAGGVLFFDEIGEMPLEIQPKILRLIQEKKFQPVGGKRALTADCRLVFATHRDLVAMSKAGNFREDLYYRINVHCLALPPLRERRMDIPLLVEHLLEQYAREHAFASREVEPAALERLVAYDWPGNIRELENFLVRLLADGEGRSITVSDLPPEISTVPARAARSKAQAAFGASPEVSSTERGGTRQAMFPEPDAAVGFEKLMHAYARELIAHTLKVCKGNRTHAAKRLGISRGKLIYQIKELGLEDFEKSLKDKPKSSKQQEHRKKVRPVH